MNVVRECLVAQRTQGCSKKTSIHSLFLTILDHRPCMGLDTSMITSGSTPLTLTMDHEVCALIKQPLPDVDELLIAISLRYGTHISNSTQYNTPTQINC